MEDNFPRAFIPALYLLTWLSHWPRPRDLKVTMLFLKVLSSNVHSSSQLVVQFGLPKRNVSFLNDVYSANHWQIQFIRVRQEKLCGYNCTNNCNYPWMCNYFSCIDKYIYHYAQARLSTTIGKRNRHQQAHVCEFDSKMIHLLQYMYWFNQCHFR